MKIVLAKPVHGHPTVNKPHQAVIAGLAPSLALALLF